MNQVGAARVMVVAVYVFLFLRPVRPVRPVSVQGETVTAGSPEPAVTKATSAPVELEVSSSSSSFSSNSSSSSRSSRCMIICCHPF